MLLPSAEGHCKEVIPDDVLVLVAGHSQNRDWGWNRRLLESSAFLLRKGANESGGSGSEAKWMKETAVVMMMVSRILNRN